MAIRSRMTVLLVAGFAATALAAADRPPTNLKLVGDHWTPWEPPTTFPEGAKIHTIVAGDTLWDLAGTYLGNSYLWPQIWEKNQYILDAHWIYPGDPLVVGIEVVPAEEVGATGEGEGEGGDEALGTAPPGGRGNVPVPLGSESDIYCSGYVGELEESFGWSIVGSEYDTLAPPVALGWARAEGALGAADTVKYKLTLGDIVYLDGGRAAGLSTGMVLEAVEPRRGVLRYPGSNDVFGRIYMTTGRVRVLSVQDTGAIAEVVQNCDGLRVGSQLRSYEPEPVPLARRTPLRAVNDPTREDLTAAPMILAGVAEVQTIGQDHVVYISQGTDADVQPGDQFTIYRLGRDGQAPVVLGELAVLSAHPRSAVAKILESRYPIYAGDRLERK